MDKNLKYRKDNKHLLLWAYIAFLVFIIANLTINIMNTKNVFNMYILFAADVAFILLYSLFYLVYVKKNKAILELEDNFLAFYVSFNKKNKKLKGFILFIDILSLISLNIVSVYYLYKMDFFHVYEIYPLFAVGIILILNLVVAIKDITRLNALDRLDYYNSSNQLSMIDRKLLFSLNLLLIASANIGILSYTKPHFIVHYSDLVVFEILAAIFLTISLLSIFITKIYYSYFDIKQIEHTETNTRVLEEIGHGKYAKVYKAYISSLNTVYAVKKLESKDVTDIERFKAEFNIMKALDHQNLLRVYSFDELRYEYVMDYCKYNLADYITNHKLSNEQKRDLTLQLLNSFDYLHSHNIMHRDVSPQNIMLKENEETHEVTLKVMDFGIAKNNNELKKTRTYTAIKGTLIDPALEDFSRYNEQNDIYGLGIIMNLINYRTDSITQDDSQVSKIIKRCMDMDLCNRYHHVKEIITDYKEASL